MYGYVLQRRPFHFESRTTQDINGRVFIESCTTQEKSYNKYKEQKKRYPQVPFSFPV